MSRTFLYGSTKGTPFHFSTMTLLDEPMPMAKRPGAASARDATHCANAAGERVNAGVFHDVNGGVRGVEQSFRYGEVWLGS
ncbi:MAG: hypothetical protein NTZ76_04960 [Actinobacteria bacterium]|nr:hypothetical protein [Actinomycetota bacterium]